MRSAGRKKHTGRCSKKKRGTDLDSTIDRIKNYVDLFGGGFHLLALIKASRIHLRHQRLSQAVGAED